MEISYWESRWRKGKIGFHSSSVNPQLEKFYAKLAPYKGIIVPFCGKSPDLEWLVNKGHQVFGIEAVELACHHFFEEQGRLYEVRPFHSGKVFESENIQLWNGNFFTFEKEMLPKWSYAIYDRAGFVAFPAQKRRILAQKYNELWVQGTGLLLHGFDYPQEEMHGPPFSVPAQELQMHFSKGWSLELLDEFSRLESLNKFRQRGLSSLMEQTWWLEKKMEEVN